jgi:hypothetical protein
MKFLRTAHGKGASTLVRIETPPIDELPAANADATARGLALSSARGRPFEPGNAAARGRKPKQARAGLDVPNANAAWERYQKQGKRYAQHRCRELAIMHGGRLGAGPSAMLADAGRARATSHWLHELAAQETDTDRAAKLAKQAVSHALDARQLELSAMAAAALESESFAETDDERLLRERLETSRALAAPDPDDA